MMLLWLIACGGSQPEGWLLSEQTGGPTVQYDLTAEPLPEIPLPNDQATRLDPTTATGRRLNISEDAPTEYERRTRRTFNRLDGFGTFSPIMVSFDAPLDIANLKERHADTDFRNDAIFLLNVDQDCNRYGEEVYLDFHSGRNPITLYKFGERQADPEAPNGEYFEDNGNLFFQFDSRFDAHNILFEERLEDVNGNGVLDEGEDLDADGRLDIPNFIDPEACIGLDGIEYNQCVADNLVNFYDRQANRLYLKPLWPLEQQCTYAVVLTKRVQGENGNAIQSPFPYVNPQSQTSDVRGVEPLLSRYSLSTDDVAFAWTFTTGSMTKDIEEVRKGLYNVGAFSQLGSEFPVSGFHPYTRSEMGAVTGIEVDEDVAEDYALPGGCVASSFSWLWGPNGMGEWPANMCALEADLASVDQTFGGTFRAPNLLNDKDGLATERYPADNDEIWELSQMTGEIEYGETDVSFWCSLPQELDTSCSEGNPEGTPFCKPFPVVMYAHGYGGSRNEISLHMGRHNAMGYAMCSLDSYGHGLTRWREDPIAGAAIRVAGVEFDRNGIPELTGLLTNGRDRDLNNDGLADPGADMWTSDVFHTRDMVRQSVVEYMQFVRMLRSMDGENTDFHGNILGDVDLDGQVDIGGPENTIGMWGISLGGILSGVLAGSEPSIDAVSPNAGGAGLVDITVRARQAGVPDAVVMPMLGQLIVGCIPHDSHQNPIALGEETDRDCLKTDTPDGLKGGDLRLAFIANDNARDATREFGALEGVQPGDRIVVSNLTSGEVKETVINERGWFRLGMPADALDPITRRPLLGLNDQSTEPGVASDNLLLADGILIEVYRGEELLGSIEEFQQEVVFQGTKYPEGSPLVVLQEGLGYERNTPEFAQFMAFAQSALSVADPGVWGAHSFLEPLNFDYDPYARGTHVLMMPTAGDVNVPVNTGIAMGRVSGHFGSWLRDEEQYPAEYGWREIFMPDERYGVSVDQHLVDTYVIEGDAMLQRYGDNHINPNVLYDVDDISDGVAEFSCGPSDWSALIGENECPEEVEDQEIFYDVPNSEPGKALRINRERDDGSYDSFRVPLLRPAGQHGIYNAQTFRTFDTDAYMVNFTVRYLGTRGGSVDHLQGCDCTASTVPEYFRSGEANYPALDGEACTEDDLRICDETCDWGLRTPETLDCLP